MKKNQVDLSLDKFKDKNTDPVKMQKDINMAILKFTGIKKSEELSLDVSSKLLSCGIDRNFKIISNGMSVADLNTFLAIQHLCFLAEMKGEGRFNVDDAFASNDNETLYRSIFPEFEFYKEFPDLQEDSIAIKSNKSNILKLFSKSRNTNLLNKVIASLISLSKVRILYENDEGVTILSYLLGFIDFKDKRGLNIIIHPRVAAAITKNAQYKYLNYNNHVSFKNKNAMLTNYYLSNWLNQGETQSVNLTTIFRSIAHDFDNKSPSTKSQMKKNFMEVAYPELIDKGWRINIMKETPEQKRRRIKEGKRPDIKFNITRPKDFV